MVEHKQFNMSGNLFLTNGCRVVLDDHNNEVYNTPADKILMTKEELTKGIFLSEFMKRIGQKYNK